MRQKLQAHGWNSNPRNFAILEQTPRSPKTRERSSWGRPSCLAVIIYFTQKLCQSLFTYSAAQNSLMIWSQSSAIKTSSELIKSAFGDVHRKTVRFICSIRSGCRKSNGTKPNVCVTVALALALQCWSATQNCTDWDAGLNVLIVFIHGDGLSISPQLLKKVTSCVLYATVLICWAKVTVRGGSTNTTYQQLTTLSCLFTIQDLETNYSKVKSNTKVTMQCSKIWVHKWLLYVYIFRIQYKLTKAC